MEISRDINSRIFNRLLGWEQKQGSLPVFMQYFRELLTIQDEVNTEAVIPEFKLTSGLLSDRIREGTPLVLLEDFQPDWAQVQRTFKKIAISIAEEGNSPAGEYESLKNIGDNQGLLQAVFKKWYQQNKIAGIQEAENIDSALLISIVAAVFKPFLRAYSAQLMPLIDQEQWQRHYCPVCGGKPDFAYLDRERGARWLICSRCDTEWLFLRVGCPYCGTHNGDDLSYLTDEEGLLKYRLYICKQCTNYLKAIDLRHANSDILLPLERLTTLGIDQKAQEMGYRPGWLTYSVDSVSAKLASSDNSGRFTESM
ncbi:MAG: hypothetical protein A2Z02_00940 [Chloroflexi bacterium RBG_16_48_7]|nr:MAG: hypothetical protein A2Z02_00940 [Chloroflexi bacterium RBG_16_48_7]